MEMDKDQKNGTMLRRLPALAQIKMNSIKKWSKETSCPIWMVRMESQQVIQWELRHKLMNQIILCRKNLTGGLKVMDKALKNGIILRKLPDLALIKMSSIKKWNKEISTQVLMAKTQNQQVTQWE